MIDFKLFGYFIIVSFALSLMLSIGAIIGHYFKEYHLKGKVKNIYYINTYDDWRNFSTPFSALTVEENFNTYVTSEILFDDVFFKYYRDDHFETARWNNTSNYKCVYCNEDNKFSNLVDQKYVLDDLDFGVKGGVQCLETWNKKQSKKKDYVESYIIFEVEDIHILASKFYFTEPDNYYITSLQFRTHTYDDVKSYVYSYASKKVNGDSNGEINTIGKYWMFAVRRTKAMNFKQDSIVSLKKYSSNRNIYIKFLKL